MDLEAVPYDDQPDLGTVERLSPGHPLVQDPEFREAHQQALEYLGSLDEVSGVEEEYIGAAVDGIVYIFLFKVRSEDVEEEDDIPWLWVIVGDVPPADLTCFSGKTPSEILKAYIREMARWVQTVLAGESVEDCAPVDVPATRENAEMLSSRLQFLEQRIVPMLEKEEK